MKQIREEELVVAAKAGDTPAFNQLILRYENEVRSVIFAITGNLEDTKDLTQDAFFRAYRKLGLIAPPYRFGSWIKQIARNLAKSYILRQPQSICLDVISESVTSPNFVETADFEYAGQIASALSALCRLKPLYREPARLAYLAGFSQKVIAHRLNIPEGTVKRRLHQARQNMQKEISVMKNQQQVKKNFNRVPEITIEPVPGKHLTVFLKGYGSYFGSVLKVGNVETVHFYDYPGGVLTMTVRSEVMRMVEICGKDCFEVLITHSECDPREPNLVDYFYVNELGTHWMMRIEGDDVYPRLTMTPDKTIAPVSYDSRSIGENQMIRVVNITIGETVFPDCLEVMENLDQATPVLAVYTQDGRELLHRRYVSPDAPRSNHYNYEQLSTDKGIHIRDRVFKLWYETVLEV